MSLDKALDMEGQVLRDATQEVIGDMIDRKSDWLDSDSEQVEEFSICTEENS